MAQRRAPKTYAAIVRGINVGGRKRVAMKDLQALFAELGADDVRTYIQSGNVVFRSSNHPAELVQAITARIHDRLGLDVTVLVRTRNQLKTIVERNPFIAAKHDPTKLHVTFLARKPDPRRVDDLGRGSYEGDEFRVAGEEIYLHCPNGYGRTKLSNVFFERKLAVPATTRNWKTVEALAALAVD
jgi:uncharacterized protein (DUF1697 family)